MNPLRQKLTLERGDDKTFSVQLTRDVSLAVSVIFTVKRNIGDEDSDALVQKYLGAGIDVSMDYASVDLVRADTVDEVKTSTLFWDIQVQWVGGASETVAKGELFLSMDVTRELTVSVPVVTTYPPINVATVSGVYYVETYGAVGDSTTDCKAFVQTAINTIPSGSTLVFSGPGTYMFSDSVLVDKSLNIIGLGSVTLKLTSDLKPTIFVVDGGRISFDNLGFHGNRTTAVINSINAALVDIRNSANIVVKNCRFYDTAYESIRMVGNCQFIIVDHNEFSGYGKAIFGDDDAGTQPSYVQVTNNRVLAGYGAYDTAYTGGIVFHGTDADSFTGNVISGNMIVSSGQMGIELQGHADHFVVASNAIYGVGFGISISACDHTTISGNTIRGCYSYGIELASGNRTSILGGIIDGRTDAGGMRLDTGIAVNDSDSVVISGVYLNKIEGDAITVFSGSTGVAITGCVIERSKVAINLKSAFDVTISGCVFDTKYDAACLYHMFWDHASGDVRRIRVSSCIFSGNPAYNAISFYGPNTTYGIHDFTISGNTFITSESPGGMLGDNQTKTLRTRGRIENNQFKGDRSSITAIVSIWEKTASFSVSYETNNYKCNTTSGSITATLPDAALYFGFRYTFIKTASANTLTINSAGGKTVFGTTSFTTQWSGGTWESDGQDWYPV